jgi:hypothetical protein
MVLVDTGPCDMPEPVIALYAASLNRSEKASTTA